MKFYSGFSLQNESHFFDSFILKSEYCVCGFSYGAIKALRYAKEQLENRQRIDTLQLFSPAFFQTKTQKFKRLQTLSYSKNRQIYIEQFIDACFLPHKRKEVSHKENILEELEELLEYQWSLTDLIYLRDRGVKIEIYLGGEDKIIDVNAAREFFLPLATVTYIKNANHFLQTN
ncbi:MAG: pimelyl-ACP methyl ester esterase BioV [Sulfurimonas sp.]|nr:pimelyl-ACP methyl ester esterase BioV [Sulfurimonas sp.]MDD3060617.1 pimelyl-ACP methyl ester esterase BioV [Sulfurimonas sp.]